MIALIVPWSFMFLCFTTHLVDGAIPLAEIEAYVEVMAQRHPRIKSLKDFHCCQVFRVLCSLLSLSLTLGILEFFIFKQTLNLELFGVGLTMAVFELNFGGLKYV